MTCVVRTGWLVAIAVANGAKADMEPGRPKRRFCPKRIGYPKFAVMHNKTVLALLNSPRRGRSL